jgi:hypothetical protein
VYVGRAAQLLAQRGRTTSAVMRRCGGENPQTAPDGEAEALYIYKSSIIFFDTKW